MLAASGRVNEAAVQRQHNLRKQTQMQHLPRRACDGWLFWPLGLSKGLLDHCLCQVVEMFEMTCLWPLWCAAGQAATLQ